MASTAGSDSEWRRRPHDPCAELCGVLRDLGFDERVHGSHHIFTREGVEEIINLQPRDGGLAKPYQVRQVRDIISRYQLGSE
jgi:hypothetical protein